MRAQAVPSWEPVERMGGMGLWESSSSGSADQDRILEIEVVEIRRETEVEWEE